MIQSIQIKNFKSVVDLTLEIGTFNVLVGENGCGKSNILEAIAFGAAASADKLDFEFLGSRGLRVSNPEFMFSAFNDKEDTNTISIKLNTDKNECLFDLLPDTSNSKKWINQVKQSIINQNDKIIQLLKEKVKSSLNDGNDKVYNEYIDPKKERKYSLNEIIELFDKNTKKLFNNDEVSNYIIDTLEQSSLRKFEETNQIYPLGIKGEGLFQYLKELTFDINNKKTLNEIKETLNLLDWYDGFDLPDNLISNEYALKIKDKYLNENLQYFDQRSTNEGFLFLLFYATLFTSKDTPTFFAIDNIDASFNPKLCVKLVRILAELAKKHNKQVIVTTHNPAILDGLNLADDSQRLFVISRNSEGHTRTERIKHNDKRAMKLSEVWTKGFIGGLPENF